MSLDYFDVKLDDQVQNLRVDNVLEVEADCRLGETQNGSGGGHQLAHLRRTRSRASRVIRWAPSPKAKWRRCA